MTDYFEEIASAAEQAVGSDRSIDGLIAHAVGCHMPRDPAGWPPHYTSSLDAAMSLRPEGWCVDAGTGGGPYGHRSWARCYPNNHRGQVDGTGNRDAATMALAICSATLRARVLNQQEGQD